MQRSTLMVQGTTSDAGKSLMVAGLCRLLSRAGVNVAPFKPQNMALNSAVTGDGGEIGRAQALQAIAAGQAATVDMNPILIKPESDQRAQVIVQGKAISSMQAQEYHHYKLHAMDYVLESYSRLSARHDVVVVEGAGSPAEINLRDNDIANMGFAEAVDCPVLLVADIDRGGVFATVVGTLDLLSESERNRVCGVVINRFRGDIELLLSGLKWLEKRINKPVLGVLPYLTDLHLDAEDAIDVQQALDTSQTILNVSVLVFPRISNHTDFDSLRLHPQVNLSYFALEDELGPCDLLILPGTKNVREDLELLKKSPAYPALFRHLRYGGKLLGICGGLQMLGSEIADPTGIEGAAGNSIGLNLLDFTTVLETQKKLETKTGTLQLGQQSAAVAGYEIHCGISQGSAMEECLIQFSDGSKDGVQSADKKIAGTYLHGLFDEPAACKALLSWAGLDSEWVIDAAQQRDEQLNRLADAIEAHVQVENLFPDHYHNKRRKMAWNV